MPVIKLLFLQILFLSFLLISAKVPAQDYIPHDPDFIHLKTLDATPVKDQYNSNTCWSFAVISLLESELLRQGQGIYDFSELYIVRHAYTEKAVKYVRMHGHINFTDGGEANDVIDIINKYGIVPEEIYPFNIVNEKNYNREMDFKLKTYVSDVVSKDDELNSLWYEGFEDILYSYLGDAPDTFTLDNKKYTPQDYKQGLELIPEDYILVTSFSHHPFYSQFIMELPDNWSWGKAYNLPLDELIEIIDSAVYNNYTVVWATDVSEKSFDFKKGLAMIPETEPVNNEDTTQEISNNVTPENNQINIISHKGKQRIITQEIRQEGFDNYTTTDDHSMHIIGISKHKDNAKYYLVKNSWGTNNYYKGYLFASENYVRYKTILLMLNRKALPAEIAIKLNIKY